MASELLINAGAGETRIAYVEDGVLQGYDAEPAIGGGDGRVGDIHLGRVTRVMAAMQAAFVNIGQDRDGFLSLRDAPAPLTEGASVAVQVTRAALGDKGAKLTAKIALPPGVQARGKPPLLLAAGEGAVERALKAWKADSILADDPRTAERCKAVLVREDLFARHDLEDQVAALWRRRVALPCGGWITIEKTEGLTAIDVNSGAFAAAGGREQTARTVNLEAASRIGRQLRLRRIGGLIAADFISPGSGGAADGEAVTAMLRAELARDAAASEVLSMNSLGVVCIARQRVGAALARPGPGLDILCAVERAAAHAPGREIIVRAAPAVTAWLGQAEVRAGLDRRGVGRVRYISEDRRGEDFDVAT